MLKIRWLWQFSCFMILGALATYAIRLLHSCVGTILVFSVPVAVLLLPALFRHTAGAISTLVRSLTWWQGLWAILFLSMFVFRQRTDTDIRQSPIDAAALYRVCLVGITAVVLAVRLAVKRPPWLGSLFRGLVGAMTCYCAMSAISTLWSVYPAWTLYKSLEYLVDVALLAAVLATVQSPRGYRTLFDWTWVLFCLLLCSVWLGLLLWPRLAWQPSDGLIGHQLYGVLPQFDANGVGELGAMLGVVSLARLSASRGDKHHRALYGVLCAVSLASLLLSQTRSATAGFLLGAALVLFFSKGKRLTTLLLLGAAAPLSVISVRRLVWAFLLRGQSPELFKSLTGRVDWWEFGWEQIVKSPWLGFGAYTARFEVLAKLGQADTAHIHNTFLEVLFGVGIVGLIPVVVALFGTWWLLIRSLRNSSLEFSERGIAVEALGVLAVVSVRSLFSSTQLIWHPPLQFLVVLGYAELLRRRLKHTREHAHLLAH